MAQSGASRRPLSSPLAPPNSSSDTTTNTPPAASPLSILPDTTAQPHRSHPSQPLSGQSGQAHHRRRTSLAFPSIRQPSPSPELDDEEDDGEEEDEDTGPRKKKPRTTTTATATGGAGATSGGGGGGGGGAVASGGKKEAKGDYKYTSEISQMMFVFGEVQDPMPETVRLVEDIVRGQIIEIVTRARLLTHLRSSRFLSAEDLIFLIRDDRGKVNRLRTYLSWKDVRKRAKEEEDGGDVDVEESDKPAPKGRKTMVKLPWELLTPFSDFLRGIPTKRGGGGGINGLNANNPTVNAEDDDEEDDDEMQAYQDSMQRLKDADEITKKMTKDEYVHYSDCRQASFTYRKARRFRDFINFAAFLDVRPNDDIIDILGFLAFEMVRSLCVTALEVRDRAERVRAAIHRSSGGPTSGTVTGSITGQNAGNPTAQLTRKPTLPNATSTVEASPLKRRLTQSTNTIPNTNTNPMSNNSTNSTHESPTKRRTSEIVASPEPSTPTTTSHQTPDVPPSTRRPHPTNHTTSALHHSTTTTHHPVSLFAPPPSARQPLLASHVLEAFSQIQRQQAANRVGSMRNWRGGVVGRNRVALV